MAEYDIKQITYKGTTHLYNYSNHTDCGISIPFQGKHLQTVKTVHDMANITCKQCLATIKTDTCRNETDNYQ